jgi:hypothetical protein
MFRRDSSTLAGEVDKIGLVCLIAKQAFVGRLLSDLWFQWLSGFPLRNLSVRDFLCAGDDVLLAGDGVLSFCFVIDSGASDVSIPAMTRICA